MATSPRRVGVSRWTEETDASGGETFGEDGGACVTGKGSDTGRDHTAFKVLVQL
tara:strand:- start:119 stop:280 length:162 start_codon:yes stop_codon:yes gene_type:complete